MPLSITEIIGRNLLETWFQPVVCVENGDIAGYEAFTRGPEGPLHLPLALFSEARRQGLYERLDLLCRENILCRAAALDLPGLLFLNVDPAVLMLDQGAEKSLNCGAGALKDPGRVVVEITTENDLFRFVGFADPVRRLHERGYRIACDNAVVGSTQFLGMNRMHPDYLKLDVQRICGEDIACYESAFEVGRLLGAQTVASGVETAAQLRALLHSPIRFAQGYFLAPPAYAPSDSIRPEAAALIHAHKAARTG